MTVISSWTGFDPLQEVWLGDVYPAHFYDHLPADIRQVFRVITEWTQQDLHVIQQFLTDRGVTVRRPSYTDNPQDYVKDGGLVKPAICPRDDFLVYGPKLVIPHALEQQWQSNPESFPWHQALDDYRAAGAEIVVNRSPLNMGGASTIRLGRDFYLDCVYSRQYHHWDQAQCQQIFQQQVVPVWPESRCHYIDNGGHVDACFSVLAPGLILATEYFDSYDTFFPGWHRIMLSQPEFKQHQGSYTAGFGHNSRWHLPGCELPTSFNDHVIRYASDWIGNYRETYFEVNCLMLDPNNVMILGHNAAVNEQLTAYGIKVHEMPFRCRTFWDGGLHCLTLDVRRHGHSRDFFAYQIPSGSGGSHA